jgi:hypothetical protein
MGDGNFELTQKEINYLAGVLYDKKDDLLKRKKETHMVDALIDKALGRITLTKKGEKIVKLFDGNEYSDITKGGVFESEHGQFTVQDIDAEHHIKVNGNWYHKSEFEPASVVKYRGHNKGMER